MHNYFILAHKDTENALKYQRFLKIYLFFCAKSDFFAQNSLSFDSKTGLL